MIDAGVLRRFLTGRVLGLAGSLGFQIAVVRWLPTAAYARYALAIGLIALLQTVTAVGFARVASKYLPLAHERLSRRDALCLTLSMFGARVGACLLILALAAPALGGAGRGLFIAGSACALTTALQFDADAVAQALGLQIASRRAAAGEPLARLLAVAALWWSGWAGDAATVLWVGAATAALATAVLMQAAFSALLGTKDSAEGPRPLDWRAVRRVAVGGYGGALSWLAFSPGVVRLIASRVLPVEVFAGFSFVQTLAGSVQRYAPSFTLFPLIEPAAMADAARTGSPARLGAALSLLVKADAIVVGALAVGLCGVGPAVVGWLTHGRYGDAAIFLPFLLLGVIANASHRGAEIAAVAMDRPGALVKALGFTLAWLLAALAAAPILGVWPLLVCPLADAATRLWAVRRALDPGGGRGLADVGALWPIAAAATATGLLGAAAVRVAHTGPLGSVCLGAAAAGAFLLLVAAARPIRPVEAALLRETFPRFGRRGEGPVRVVVLTPRGPGGTGGVDRLMDSLRPALALRPDVKVRFVTTRGARRWASPLVTARAMITLTIAAALRRVDVIHVNLGAYGGCYRKMALIAVPRMFGVPYVLHLHGSAFGSFWAGAPPLAGRAIDRLFRGAAEVVVLGAVWRDLVTSRLPDLAGRVRVMPNATAVHEAARTQRQDPVLILFLGELSPRKGYDVLLQALGRLEAASPWRAVMAGDGAVGAARATTQRLGLSTRVDIPGWVGPAEVSRLLASADILVLPSFEENLPMSVIEAFAAGLAVIATPVGALPDILKPGETGLLIAPGDVTGLAAALDAVIEDADLRRHLGGAARAFHDEHLALGPYLDALVRLWRNPSA